MRTRYTEQVGRRAKLMGSGAWDTFGWLELPLHPDLLDRALYCGVIIAGFSDYRTNLELALYQDNMEVWSASKLLVDNNSRLAYAGSSTGWGIASHVLYSKVLNLPGFPAWTEAVTPEYAVARDEPAAADTLIWWGTSDTGYGKALHRITCYPYHVLARANSLRFRFRDRSFNNASATPTGEVFIGCRSRALVR